MADLEYTLSLANKSFLAGMREAEGSMGGVENRAKAMGATIKGAMLPLSAILAVAGTAFLGLKKAIGGAASLEQTTIAFQTLTGSVEKGNAALASLRELGANTPLEFPELADAGKKLIAFGESTETLVPTLTRIGDIAAGVGAPIGEMAELYGKARVQGTLFAEDLNQLMGRGVPIMQELAKVTGQPVDQIKELASQGKITFPLLEQAFKNLTAEGSMFGGMLEKQSQTTAGLWSTLKDGINDVFVSLGQPVNDALGPLLRGAIESVKAFGERVSETIATMQALSTDGNLFAAVGLGLKIGFLEAVHHLRAGLNGAALAFVSYLGHVPKIALEYVKTIANPQLYVGIGLALQSAFYKAGEALLRAIEPALKKLAPDDNVDHAIFTAETRAGNFASMAANVLGQATQGYRDEIVATAKDAANAYVEGFNSVERPAALANAQDELQRLLNTANAKVEEQRRSKEKADADKDAAKASKSAATETNGLSAAIAKAADKTKKATKDGDKPKARAGTDPLASLVNRFNRQREDTRGTFKDFVFGSGANQHRLTRAQLRNIGSGAITPESFADYYGTAQANLDKTRARVTNPNAVPASQRARAAAAEASRAASGNAATIAKIVAHVASLDDRIKALTAA